MTKVEVEINEWSSKILLLCEDCADEDTYHLNLPKNDDQTERPF